jgi:hypothetical protein
MVVEVEKLDIDMDKIREFPRQTRVCPMRRLSQDDTACHGILWVLSPYSYSPATIEETV